ncbi:transglutaminase-like domain-containing protein [Rummeliibacillus suwonensis]|uniref:transglutaminase-like domain-containing protein n=1 Tax=Rummeliibacillus suwonensis TaxID=1306154 RepID=UPI00289693FB|nr:transglutaminase domain-containing protein [Rummeliibacillus suwonensis]
MKKTISFDWKEQQNRHLLLGFAILCFLASIYSAIKELFQIKSMSYTGLVVLTIVAMILEWQKKEERIFRYTKFGFLLVVLCSFPLWLSGLTTLYNEAAETVGKTMGYDWTQYDVKEGMSFYTICLITVFLAYMVQWSIKRMSSVIYIVMAVLVFTWQMISIHSLHWLLNAAIVITLVLVIWLMKQPKLEINVLFQLGTVIVVMACMIIGLAFLMKQPTWQKESFMMTHTKALWEQWQYGGEKVDWHTNGDMQKLAKAKTTDKVAMTVMMEKPTSLYLRGFVGASYDQNKWQPLSNEIYYKEQALLHGLREKSFSSDTLLAQTFQLVEKSPLSEVRIYPKSVSTKYSYTPYELATQPMALGFEHDGLNEKNTWTKAENYRYKIASAARVHYPITASKLQASKADDFFAMEGHYNEFVYKQYIAMTKMDRTILQTHYGNRPKERLPYETAMKKVQKFVKNELRYDENAGELPKGKNFVQYTLEDTKRGYSPHYATIATLTFRYLGIPARYVEGYLVTPSLMKHKQAYTDIAVTGKEAHAWVEIYIDQLGWIPVEVTPGYENKMPKVETLKAITNQKSMYSSSIPQQSVQREKKTSQQQVITDKDSTIEPAPKKENNQWSMMKKLLLVGSILLLLLICFISWYVYRNRHKLHKWEKALQSDDPIMSAKAPIAILEGQFMYILKLAKPDPSLYSWLAVLPIDMVKPFRRVMEDYQSIRYSPITKDSTELLRNYHIIREQIDRNLSIYQKMYFWLKGVR